MSEHLELDPVDRITVGAVGEPGQRMFLLQAAKGDEIRTWVLEKEHVMALGTGSNALLAQIGRQDVAREVLGEAALGAAPAGFAELMALQPDEPLFRIDPNSMAMGYDDSRDMVMISFAEYVPPPDDVPDVEELEEMTQIAPIEDLHTMPPADPQAPMEEMVEQDRSTARLWLTRRQLAALGIHGMTLVSQGRPVCPLCGGVMEEGHKCPPQVFNGQGRKRPE